MPRYLLQNCSAVFFVILNSCTVLSTTALYALEILSGQDFGGWLRNSLISVVAYPLINYSTVRREDRLIPVGFLL
jgi:hypothetical protein